MCGLEVVLLHHQHRYDWVWGRVLGSYPIQLNYLMPQHLLEEDWGGFEEGYA